MYQTIVLGLGFLLLFGAGYLIKNMDSAGIITSNIVRTATSTTDTASTTAARDISGTYICDLDSGCQNPSILTISGEGEVTMVTSYDNGVEVLRELGTWKDGKDSGLTILLTGTEADIYPTPHTFFAKYVSATSLSGIAFDGAIFKDWKIPVFRKQDNQEE